MKEITIRRNKGGEIKEYLFDITKESCPLCDKPLKESGVAWNIFHGEVNRFCCNSPWQTKDFSPPTGEEETYKKYFIELNKPEFNSLSIKKELWQPIREAFEKLGKKDCRDNAVFEEVKKLRPDLF